MKQPNVLFIFADQMRGDSMGCAGHPMVQTPNIDRLAERGVMFSNAYSPDPVCVPARATVTTGNYPHKCTGIKSNGGRIADDQLKIAEYFASNGYATYAAGKLHYCPYSPPGEQRLLHGFQKVSLTEEGRILSAFDPAGGKHGLEDYHDYLKDVGWGGYQRGHGINNNDIHPAPSPLPQEHCVDAWVASRTIDYLKQHKHDTHDKPFFMFMSFTKPHAPYDPPAPYDTMYDPREVPDPLERRGETMSTPTKHLEEIERGWSLLSPETHRVARAHYYGLISFQDKQIGRLLEHLQNEGLDDDTIIVYSADHGDMIGDFGFFGKSCFYKGSVNVPMIMSFPERIPAGERSDALVGLQDIFPTLASLAGIPLPVEVDGCDLTPALKSGSESVRDFYVSCYYDSPRQICMIADHKRKYIHSQVNGFEEFFDLENDPEELCNAINDPAKTSDVEELKTTLIDWARENDLSLLDKTGALKETECADILEKAEFKRSALGVALY